MAIRFTYPVDKLDHDQLIADGWTHLTLWYSDTPEGPYALGTATFDPATLAAAETAEDYSYDITSGYNAGQYFKIRAYDGADYSDINLAKPFHGGGGTTLTALRRLVGALTGDMYVVDTTASGSTTSAVSSNQDLMQHSDGHFENWKFYHPANNEQAIVSASVRASGSAAKMTLTLEPAVTAVGSAETIELTKRWTRAAYVAAINWAVDAAYPVLHRGTINIGHRTAEDTHQYDVPLDIRKVHKVEIESYTNQTATTNASFGQPWKEVAYRVLGDGLQQTIEFKAALPYLPSARRIRITGEAALSKMYADSDFTEASLTEADLIAALAASRLYSLLAGGAASVDRDFYKEQASFYLGMYSDLKQALARGRSPKRVWSHDAVWMGATS